MELVILKESQMTTQMGITFLKSEWTNTLLEEIMELVVKHKDTYPGVSSQQRVRQRAEQLFHE
eukprot:15205113-Heterocapsa_arctica.AAC.1